MDCQTFMCVSLVLQRSLETYIWLCCLSSIKSEFMILQIFAESAVFWWVSINLSFNSQNDFKKKNVFGVWAQFTCLQKHLQILHASDDLSNPGNLPTLPSLQLVFEQKAVSAPWDVSLMNSSRAPWNYTRSFFSKKTCILRWFNKWKQIDAKAWDSTHLEKNASALRMHGPFLKRYILV